MDLESFVSVISEQYDDRAHVYMKGFHYVSKSTVSHFSAEILFLSVLLGVLNNVAHASLVEN